MSLLNKIATEVSPRLGGIDWALLEAEFGMPREEIVYDTSRGTGTGPGTSGIFRYVEAIREAAARTAQALERFQFSWSVEDNPATAEDEVHQAMEAWRAVQYDTIEIGDQVLTALRKQVQFLSENDSLQVEKEHLRAVISSTYFTTVYGGVVHVNAFLQRSDVAPEDIVANADNIVKTFNALTQLANMGVLEPFMLPSSSTPAAQESVEVQGTGAVPVAVWIAVTVVVGVAIIAWCIVSVMHQQETNRAIRIMCEEAQRTGTEEDKARCAELVKLNMTSSAGGPDIAGAAKSIGQAAVMIAIAYGAFLVLPPLVKGWKLKQSRRESRQRYYEEAV